MSGHSGRPSICRDGHEIESVEVYCKVLSISKGRGIECVYFRVDAPNLMTTRDDMK